MTLEFVDYGIDDTAEFIEDQVGLFRNTIPIHQSHKNHDQQNGQQRSRQMYQPGIQQGHMTGPPGRSRRQQPRGHKDQHCRPAPLKICVSSL